MKNRYLAIPFNHLNRRTRKRILISLKNKIRINFTKTGERFMTHSDYFEDGRPNILNMRADVRFLSRDGRRFWYGDIKTASCAFWDALAERSSDDAQHLINAAKEYEDISWKNIRDLIGKPPRIYDSLGGLTRYEFTRKREQYLAAMERPIIHEVMEIKSGYPFNNNVKIIIDVEGLTLEVINQAIENFLDLGEKSSEAEAPVLDDRLPAISLSEYMRDQDLPFFLRDNRVRPRLTHKAWVKKGRDLDLAYI